VRPGFVWPEIVCLHLQIAGPATIYAASIILRCVNGGWPSRAAFFVLDGNEANHLTLEAKLAAIIAPTLDYMGFELVRVTVLGRDRPTVQVMADRADGSLISISDCETISRQVSAVLDVEDPIPGAWNLEVSSAGIDRPLTRLKDWVRFAGHQARAETHYPVNGRKRYSGLVLGADESNARMRLDDGTEVALKLADIKRAKLVLTDALIEFTNPSPRTN
jgi:ribosome maturation factor RimP